MRDGFPKWANTKNKCYVKSNQDIANLKIKSYIACPLGQVSEPGEKFHSFLISPDSTKSVSNTMTMTMTNTQIKINA